MCLLKNLVDLVGLVAKGVAMQEKIEERHKKIAHIQNTVWGIYKTFLNNHDMAEYNERWAQLMEQYRNTADEELFSFCKCQFITWEPIIRNFGAELRNGKGEGNGADSILPDRLLRD